jgi:hypothetical protein
MDISEGREGALWRQGVHDGVEQFTLSLGPKCRPWQAADDGIGLTEAAVGKDGGDVTGIGCDRVETGVALGQQGGETFIDVEGDMAPSTVESLLYGPAECAGTGAELHDDRLPL